jgi:hypothetical protein
MPERGAETECWRRRANQPAAVEIVLGRCTADGTSSSPDLLD